MIRERTHGEKLAYLAGYVAAIETAERSGLEVARAAVELMSTSIEKIPGKGETHPAPGSLPKIPQSVFNLEKKKRDA